jgi:hypothetical protein
MMCGSVISAILGRLGFQLALSSYTKPPSPSLVAMADPSWDIPYLHSPNKADEETITEDDFPRADSVFTICLRGGKTEYKPHEFLQACWTNGFDTPCSVCDEGFDIAVSPPVRLLSLEQDLQDPDPSTKTLPPLVITNYHLRCLKSAHVKYFPISHAWHQSIAEAYALRAFNPGAAQACYEVPIRTLLAVVRRFGSGVHLWHDYISIPQWQDEYRGTTILPQIFEIFKTSECAIIHLALKPPIQVMETPTFDALVRHKSEFKRFFDAHLFHRLWPVIEFTRAGEAYIMSSKYEIMTDTFSVFMEQILDVSGVNTTQPDYLDQTPAEWISNLPLFVREKHKDKCLGYVFDMISNQGCRSFRDKIIGASELLNVPEYPTKLPTDPQDACLWLSERQLAVNDFSPLLLRPSTEQRYGKAHWLKGHTEIAEGMWGWGVQTHAARMMPQLQGHSVRLELELVGTVENILSWTPPAEDLSPKTYEMIPNATRSLNGSPQALLRDLQMIHPSQLFGATNTNKSFQVPELRYQIPTSGPIASVLKNVLTRFVVAMVSDDRPCITSVCAALASVLALSASQPPPDLTSFEHLGPLYLSRQLCDPLENSLAFVSCSDCHMRSALRVDVWRRPGMQAQLYLIPGLGYQYSVPGGTGIIVEEGEVVGRVRFGASACKCGRREVVELT